MKQQVLALGVSVFVGFVAPAFAVQPAPINPGDNVAWSKVVENPFDGKIVYDRNYEREFVFVSSWAKSGIRATYAQVQSTLVGYEYVPSFFGRKRFWGGLSAPQPVYRQYLIENVPDAINFAINGKIYTYESGPVSPELAEALANAPTGNLTIRLVWKDGRTRDTEIGKDTVRAWKEIFQPS